MGQVGRAGGQVGWDRATCGLQERQNRDGLSANGRKPPCGHTEPQNVTFAPKWTRVDAPMPCATARLTRMNAAENQTLPPTPCSPRLIDEPLPWS